MAISGLRKAGAFIIAVAVGGILLTYPLLLNGEIKNTFYKTPTPQFIKIVDPKLELLTKYPTAAEEVFQNNPNERPTLSIDSFLTPNFIFPTVTVTNTPEAVNFIVLAKRSPLDGALSDLNVTSTELSILQTLIPVAGTIEQASNYYGLDPLWSVQIGLQESDLFPLAKSDTNDYGLTQIKVPIYAKYFARGTNEHDRYYTPFLKQNYLLSIDDQVFDVEGNIWVHHIIMAHARNEVRIHPDLVEGGLPLTTPMQLYAWYSRGDGAILPNGDIGPKGEAAVSSVLQKYFDVKKIIPLLGLTKEEILQLSDPQVRDSLLIFVNESTGKFEYPSPIEGYANLIAYNLDYLSKTGNNYSLKDKLIFANTVRFCLTMETIYGTNENANYLALRDFLWKVQLNKGDLSPTSYFTIYGNKIPKINP